MQATCLVCTLKRSPEESNSGALAQVVLGALHEEGVETDVIRLADHQIDFGVVSEAVSDGDEWPGIRERILASEILMLAIPTWLGQPSSVSKVALERMDAFLSETTTTARRRSPTTASPASSSSATKTARTTSSGRPARALNDIGYSMPGQNWTYWNKGPEPSEEEWLTTEERDWSITTAKACASNLLALGPGVASLADPAAARPDRGRREKGRRSATPATSMTRCTGAGPGMTLRSTPSARDFASQDSRRRRPVESRNRSSRRSSTRLVKPAVTSSESWASTIGDRRQIQLTDRTDADRSPVGVDFAPERLELCTVKRHRTS